MGEITNKDLKFLAPIVHETIRETLGEFAVNPEVSTHNKGVLNEDAFAQLATHNIIKQIIKENERRCNSKPIGNRGGN